LKIDITHTLKDADAVLNALPRDIFNAQRSAERDTVRFAKNQTQNRMIERTGVPARVFRRIKGRIRTKNTQQLGVVWLGFNKIAAAYLGRMQQTRTGARAGKFFFEGGFIATMKSGHKSVWYRKGADRLPIKEATQDINVGFEVMQDVARLAEIELKNKFREHVLRLNPHLS
jgi:hypothetical protein